MNDRITRQPPTDILIDAFRMDIIAQARGLPTGHVERAAEITRQMKSSTERGGARPNKLPPCE